MVDEAAWRRLNISLTCGQGKMKFKAMGPGASDFQLDMGITTHNQTCIKSVYSDTVCERQVGMFYFLSPPQATPIPCI